MSTDSNGSKAVKAGLGYTIGNILIRGLSFLALPIFSRLMDTEQFGIYNGFVAIDSIIYVITGLALHSSVKSAHYTFRGETDKYISSLSIIYILNYIIFNFIVLFFGNKISTLFDLPVSALYMLLLYSSGSAILTLYNYRISLEYSFKKYLLLSLINTVGSISLSLLLIISVFNNSRAMGRIVGSSIVIAGIAIYLIGEMWYRARPHFNKKYWSFGIKYSLPIIPHGISQVLLSQFDRIMIRKLDSDASAGIYSLAANIKIILTVISESISTAWSTWFFEEIDKKNTVLIQKRASQLAWMFAFFSAGMIAVSPEMIIVLGGKNYILGKYVAIPMIIDAFILFLYNIIVPSEYYMKKTKYIMFGTLCAAVINVITNYIFIKMFGFIAAAYTTLFAYICYVVLHMFISYKLVNFHIISLKNVFWLSAVIIFSAVLNNIFIDKILLRYLLNIIFLLVMGYRILVSFKNDGIDVLSIIRNKLKSKRV